MSTSDEQNRIIESIKSEQDVMQKVRLLNQLTKPKDIKIKDIADKMGVKSSYVCHLLRLNKLPEVVVDGYYSNSISLSHLFIISRLKESEKIIEVYEKILANSLTVRGTEEVVREILFGLKTEGEYLSRKEREDFIQKITGLRKNFDIKIIQTRIKSKIIFELSGSLDKTSKDVRRILNKLDNIDS